MPFIASAVFLYGRIQNSLTILAWFALGAKAVSQMHWRNIATILHSDGEVDVENSSKYNLLDTRGYSLLTTSRKVRGGKNRDLKDRCTVSAEGPSMGIGGLIIFTFNSLLDKAANEDCAEVHVQWKNCLYCKDGHNPFSQLFVHPVPINEDVRKKARAASMETPLCQHHMIDLTFGCHAEFDLETQTFMKPWNFRPPLQPHHDVLSAAFNALIRPLPDLWQAVPRLKKPVLAVQVRAAAYADLGPFEMVPIKSYVTALHDLYAGPARDVTTTFLMTDSAEAVPLFKEHAREPFVTNQNAWRGTQGGDPIEHLQGIRKVADRVANARQVLIEVLTASQAEMFLHHESALAKLAFLFAKKQRSFFIANPSERKTMLSLANANTEEEHRWLMNCAWQNKHFVFEDAMGSCTGEVGELHRGRHGFCVPVQNHWDGQLGKCCRTGTGNDGYKLHCREASLQQMSTHIRFTNISTD